MYVVCNCDCHVPKYLYTDSNDREKVNTVATRRVSLREGIHQHHVIHMTEEGAVEEQRILK